MAAALALTVAGCGGDNASTAGTDSATVGSTPATPVIDPGDGGAYEPDLDPANSTSSTTLICRSSPA